MVLLSVLAHFASAVVLTWVANWLGLIPWRRAKDFHWTERARLLWPVRATAVSNMFFVPIIVDQLHRLLCPETATLWMVNGLAACAGSMMGNQSTDREIYPQLTFRSWLFQSSAGWGFKYATWFILIAACIFMPKDLGWEMAGVTSVYLLIHFAIQFGFFLKYLRVVKFIKPAEERLRRIVEETSTSVGARARATWQMAGVQATAFAFPTTNELIFSDQLLEICDDEEVAAICAHEVAHLTESKTVLAGRLLGSLILCPFIFINPLIHAFGIFGLLVAYGGMLVLVRFNHWLSRRMEKLADQLAVSKQLNEGVYARALEKIYRENLIPAVNINDKQTHPHLFDRMVSAGITPDFPRPSKAKKMTWIGIIYAAALGILFVAVSLRGAFDTAK